ncbi:protein peanut isoform X3 [Folsomia candida]|uniref:protein peanut isoform X3 n=1 Tax=Folsomia candida TaxID=158441 RepID=UPI001605471F|nr:protein peanut isoform X3 [Folsomia candida]
MQKSDLSSLRSGPQPFRQSPAKTTAAATEACSGGDCLEECSSASPSNNSMVSENFVESDETRQRTSTPQQNKSPAPLSFDMSGSNLNLNLGSKNAITSQHKNLASASLNAATTLLYSSGLSTYSSGGSSRLLRGNSEVDKTIVEETKQKGASSAGQNTTTSRTSTTTTASATSLSTTAMSNSTTSATSHTTNGSSTTGVAYTNGSSLTGTGSYSSSTGGNYRLASLDRLAQRQKLYEQNGSAVGDNLQSKREMFFKNDSSPAPALVNTINTSGPSAAPTAPTAATVGGLAAKPDISSRNAIDTSVTRTHHTNGNNIEDNKEREMKEKMKLDRPEKDKRKKELDGYVGFANLPNQVYRKAVKRGFDFTLMVVGESGLGKSTLTNSMFLADIYSPEYPGPSLRLKKTVQVDTSKVTMKENGVNLSLTIVDTPGYGDSIDNSQCWQPILDYIENRYEDFLNAESRVNRKTLLDSRVHCCLYFIAPSGHGLKALDIEFMKKLHDKVNIIPILSKADTMTPEECSHFKKQVMNQIKQHQIKIYEFPDCDDEEENKINKQMRDRVPFAVVGSNTVVEVDGKKARGRKYPWGTVLVENLEHCDFVALRNMVVRTHLQDLKDVTNNVHYENFRCRKLAGLGPDGKPVKGFDNKNPLAQMEEEKKNHDAKMKKMEIEMEQVFEMKVKERSQRITDSEKDLKRREEQMKVQLEKLKRDIADKKKQFENDKLVWEQANGISVEELRRRSLEALSKETSPRKSFFKRKSAAKQGKVKEKKTSTSALEKVKEGSIVSAKSKTSTLVPFSGIVTNNSNSNGEPSDSVTSVDGLQQKTATVKRSTSMPKSHPTVARRRTSFKGHECSQS